MFSVNKVFKSPGDIFQACANLLHAPGKHCSYTTNLLILTATQQDSGLFSGPNAEFSVQDWTEIFI